MIILIEVNPSFSLYKVTLLEIDLDHNKCYMWIADIKNNNAICCDHKVLIK
mgnify:CR=1 FL=1